MRAHWMLTLVLGCSGETASAPAETDTADTATTPETGAEQCVTPTAEDHLYPPYPEVPAECIEDFWDCPFEDGYATVNPTTTCNITEGFDADGTLQAQFWEAYSFARDYFGAFGPVYVYFMGPSSEESNSDIWQLRAERHAVPDACYPVEQQVADFLDSPYSQEELDAANSGSGGYFSISGGSGCSPLMDLMMINPMRDEIRPITLHEYNHIFQVAHIGTHDRDADDGLNSWIMEGQATYSAAWFGDQTGWGPDFVSAMMALKNSGGSVSRQSIDDFLASEGSFDLADESYWSSDSSAAAVVYYQLGAWAWAYIVHSVDGDVDVVLKDFIADVPSIGRAASFEKHFGMTMEDFFSAFDAFVQGSNDEWQAILE